MQDSFMGCKSIFFGRIGPQDLGIFLTSRPLLSTELPPQQFIHQLRLGLPL